MSLDAEAKLAELSERLAQAESAVAAKSENALSALQKENDKLKYQRMCLKRSLEEVCTRIALLWQPYDAKFAYT